MTENEPLHVEQLSELNPEELDNFLAKFYASLQTKKGTEYSKSALTGLRAGINRFFTQPPYNRAFKIMKDRSFQKSNNVLSGTIKEMKRAGKDTTENKEPISQSDLQKLKTSGLFSTETPQTLQNKVFFDVMSHFGRRGREGLRSLHPSSFKCVNDSDGHRYVAMAYNESDKTHHGVDSKEKPKAPRMYETKDESCPVKAFEKYLSKLNPENDAFFQKPLVKFHKDAPTWYSKIPVGINQLYNFMPRLSAEAGLSKRYTNHCIRAMVASTLSDAGVSNLGIMSVTGHRNVQSLNSYIKPSDNERRAISGILSRSSISEVSISRPQNQYYYPCQQSRFLGYPTRPENEHNNLSQFNSQSNSKSSSFSIFSGNITGGNVTVNIYKV